jgi:hypothetical protein
MTLTHHYELNSTGTSFAFQFWNSNQTWSALQTGDYR